MAENTTQRKLTAILSMDVKGYSKLMGDDDELTVNTITSYREIIADLIKNHQGRVVDTPGDNILAEFSGALNAVNSAIEIQQKLAIKNGKLPPIRRMEFRIGINLGDVLHRDDRIYGDGVNVAARIEGLADPGGISISRGVFDQVKKKVRQGFEYMGEHEVKNISEPVRIYRVLLDERFEGKILGEPSGRKTKLEKPYASAIALLLIFSVGLFWYAYQKQNQIDPASINKMAFPLPEKPSIAVLPFDNMSGDPSQDFFSDGLTDQIITTLSKISNLFVISRNSSFIYKGKPANVTQVAEELGVKYVLEGSVQKTEDRVRINAQLIDAVNGTHLWAERYDSQLKNIFDLQDELTKKIISSLQIKLTYGEDAKLLSRYTNSLEAYLKVLEGHAHQMQLNKVDNIFARQLYEKAIDIDHNYATAYIELAWTHLFDANYGWSESREKSIEKAYQLAKKALNIDASFAGIYAALGSVHLQRGKLKEAIELRKKAVALEPNSANYHALLGITYLFKGNAIKEAIAELKNAHRLDPFPPNWIIHYLGTAYRLNGEYDKAINFFQKAINNDPNYWISHLGLTICYGLLNQPEKAQKSAVEVLRIDPNFTINRINTPFKDKEDKYQSFEVLRKAGMR